MATFPTKVGSDEVIGSICSRKLAAVCQWFTARRHSGLTACSAQNPDAEDASGVTTEDEFEIDAGTESEPESEDGSGDVGSRAHPIPRGTEAAIGPDWHVKVLGTESQRERTNPS